jgi:hypothetical protein
MSGLQELQGGSWVLVNVAGRVRVGLLNSFVKKTGYYSCIP